MTENIIKLDIKSFQDMCKQIIDLKAHCRELTEENLLLKTELADKDFINRNLLGTPMSQADIAEETAIANGEAHYAKFCGDDF